MRPHLSGELKGGLTAAMTAVPVELVYGLFAVAPLGVAFAEHGMRAALLGCIIGGLAGFMFRGNGGMLTGTRSATGLLLGALALTLLNDPAIRTSTDPAQRAFILLLFCTFLAGVFQFLLGLFQVGRMLKYIPFPVTSGLMFGVGILMLMSSLRPALGVDPQSAWSELGVAWQPASLLVTGISLAICILAPRLRSPIPGAIYAFVLGSAVHHGLAALVGSARIGGTSANINGLLPEFLLWKADMSLAELFGWLPVLSPYALTIAVIGSLETLMCLSTIGNVQGRRLQGNHELRVQGLGNLIAGICGGTAAVGNLARVQINLAAGGRGRVSGIVYAAALTIIVMFIGPYLDWVPHAVTAGIVIYYAAGMVDEGARRILFQLVRQRHHSGEESYRTLFENFVVIMLVATVTVLGDMMKGVGIGMAAAMFLFIRTRMKPVVRRISHGDRRRSLKVRAAEDVARLDQHGTRIAILEAEGPLFFGTADSLAFSIEKAAINSGLLIIDFRHVNDIDATGARMLVQISKRLVAQDRRILLSSLHPPFQHFLTSMGLGECVPASEWHADLDQALEAAEEWLLSKSGGQTDQRVLTLGQTDLAAGLTHDEANILLEFLISHRLPGAVPIFHFDDEGDSLYVAIGSSIDIVLPLKNGRQKRLVSLAPGVIFGEMAMLEGKRRSTTAVLQQAGEVLELSRPALDRMLLQHPTIARQVLFNVGCQLATRLRVLTSEVLALEEA